MGAGIPPDADDFDRSWIAAEFVAVAPLAVGNRRRPTREAFRRAVELKSISVVLEQAFYGTSKLDREKRRRG